VLACVASCGVRVPPPVDVDRLLAAQGPVEARRTLEIRVIGDPRDVAGRLALAALDDRIGRPSEAIDALEQVVALGGPAGVRWRAEDKARLATLIAARGKARLARGAATARADLERARELGAAIGDDELRGARATAAIVALRHSDAEIRDGGKRTLAALAEQARGFAGINGARTGATPEERGRFGAWLWDRGARRAAWEELSAWHAATRPPREPALQAAFLTAARWWLPLDATAHGAARAGVTVDDRVGAMQCAFGACAPRDVVGDEAAERAYLMAPVPAPVREPAEVAALAVITLRAALRGEGSRGRMLAARVDLAAFAEPKELARLPAFARPTVARLVGLEAELPHDGATPDERLVIAAERVMAGASAAEIAAMISESTYGAELRRVAEAGQPFHGNAVVEAAARHASGLLAEMASTASRASPASMASPAPMALASPAPAASPVSTPLPSRASIEQLRAIVTAYLRDPAIADRLGRDAVAGATDGAAMHATLGALFDGLGDPGRARAAWQAAVDASPEPIFVRGLAVAQARQGDADAALVSATTAAAASGDPAVVWTAVARELEGAGKYVHALEAVRSAIDLAGPETLPAALDVAIAASHALGRDAQAEALAAQRARVVGRDEGHDGDPTDGKAALAAYRERASGGTIARLWVASRWNRRDVALRAALYAATAPEDARHAVIAGELIEIAGDRDLDLGCAAVAALR
jgi:tetratricopeptide (TPR) repeat protein